MIDQLIHETLSALLPALGAAIAAYLIVIAHKLAKRIGLANESAFDSKIQYAASEAARIAEEQIEAYIKRSGVVMTAESKAKAKLDTALAALLAKIPGLDQAKALDAIHAVLSKISLGATAGK